MKHKLKMIKTYSAGGVVLNTAGHVLIVNQNGRSWSLPKGHLEAGENDLAAARREIYEESGIEQLVFVRPLGQYQRFKIGEDLQEDVTELKIITLFLFTTEQQNLAPIDPENPEAVWIEKNRVVDLLTHPKDKEFFARIVEPLLT